jgi:DNA polymerase III epsilon subunit-like protein
MIAAQDEIYVSVDIEASGPIPGDYSMLSIGACLVRRPERRFYREIRPISADFVADALKVSGLSMSALARTGVEPSEAMREFGAWVRSSSADREPVMVAFNASFDWSFINWYFVHFGIENPFGIGAIDIKSYYMGLTGTSWSDSRSSEIPEPYASRGSHTHNAVDDAVEQASMFVRMLAAPRHEMNRARR